MDLPDYDVVVIGAGPAGARVARLLAESGRQVQVFDAGSPQREKLCGGLLNRRAQDLVSQWGGLPSGVRIGATTPAMEFPALEYHDRDNRIRARYTPGYRNINRQAFDAWLVDLARDSGAQFCFNARVTAVEPQDGFVTLRAAGRSISAGWVVDASGGQALTRRCLAGPAVRMLHSVQGTVELNPAPDAMWGIYQTQYTPFFGWIIPKGDNRFLLGTGLTRPGIRRLRRGSTNDSGLNPSWQLLSPLLGYFSERGISYRIISEKPGGAPLTWPSGTNELWWGTGRLVVAGEATGLVSPFSGEGISYALASAEAAAFAVVSGGGARRLPAMLSPQRRRLTRATYRAYVGMTPLLRPWGLLLLPFHARTPLTYLRWSSEAGH